MLFFYSVTHLKWAYPSKIYSFQPIGMIFPGNSGFDSENLPEHPMSWSILYFQGHFLLFFKVKHEKLVAIFHTNGLGVLWNGSSQYFVKIC